MSQQDIPEGKKVRRAPRSQRNRPVLITSTAPQLDAVQAEEQQVVEPVKEEAPASSAAPARSRMPKFFSTVGKKAVPEEQTTEKADIAEARLNRVMRSKGGAQPTKPAEKSGSAPKTAARSTAAQPQQNSLFKPRYIFGMLLYIIAAQVLGGVERWLLATTKSDIQLFSFDLFGSRVNVSVFTLLFISTLVIVLVVLARLDLLPRRLTPAPTTGSRRSSTTRSSSSAGGAVQKTPPAPKQGVKGEDDALYRQYREGLRKEKKQR